jgi:hypothetical protein
MISMARLLEAKLPAGFPEALAPWALDWVDAGIGFSLTLFPVQLRAKQKTPRNNFLRFGETNINVTSVG